jgi:hypothetical protein
MDQLRSHPKLLLLANPDSQNITTSRSELNSDLFLGEHNPFNNLWTDSSEVLRQSEQFARDVLRHIPQRNAVFKSKLSK